MKKLFRNLLLFVLWLLIAYVVHEIIYFSVLHLANVNL